MAQIGTKLIPILEIFWGIDIWWHLEWSTKIVNSFSKYFKKKTFCINNFNKKWVKLDKNLREIGQKNCEFSSNYWYRPIGHLGRIFGRIISAEVGRIFGRIFGIGRILHLRDCVLISTLHSNQAINLIMSRKLGLVDATSK